MYIRQCILIFFLLLSIKSFCEERYCFRVYLNDKGDSGYSLDNPENFLSQAAIDRRLREGKFTDESDLPIAASTIDLLVSVGGEPVVQSKWFSTVVVASDDSTIVDRLKELPVVDSVQWVWKGVKYELRPEDRETSLLTPNDEPMKTHYGYAQNQIEMLNGIRLHEEGYRGKGVHVAVIDAGFMNVDRISAFQSLDIVGTHNVVCPGQSVFDSDEHGTKVLSCMAANLSGLIVGTAPEASYWLIKSEDGRSEYPIEEDYWIAAVEFADSVGVKVITSSLGYFHYDCEELSYDPSMLDGKTALITRAADMAAEKGILLFISAGNEGSGQWRKITFPSDAKNVLTVGAITDEKVKSSFSSVGFTEDARVKPDVVALGTATTVIDSSGNIRFSNGTSFSTPVLAGLGICLWQALPWLNNLQVIELIQQFSSQYKRPDIELGYGIPDIYEAVKSERRNDRN